jgi:predicted ester cyclase
VVLTYMSGKHTAPFLGLPATNRSFRQRQVHLFRVDEHNKVREHLAQRDDLGLRRQLTE